MSREGFWDNSEASTKIVKELKNLKATVEPWERGTLSKPQMAMDPHPAQRALDSHIHTTREAASGGASAGGGGCGCN